ncbi:hypothetical protein DPEC_G00050590 [Dallia pectoralis]|uniref:Uncharacterized protein n=1 Tax=Dallia pectoralis TaxID=75939 RepID=A0ACC2HB16_DALPE|nr:hypothetical protein DPEC_G00050590 [Dallia pectoralis]
MCISALLVGPWSDHLVLVLGLLFLLCDRDDGADQNVTCPYEVRVRRNTVLKARPLNPLTMKCQVQHCGDPPHVTWCKIMDPLNCRAMIENENINIHQKELPANEVMSFMTFNKLSMDDQGQYRCKLSGSEEAIVSHAITVNVSESNVGYDYSGNNTGKNTIKSKNIDGCF